MASQTIVFISRDPILTIAGDVSYLRAHMRVLKDAGFEPRVFCAASRNEVIETEYGFVHRVWTPFRPLRAVGLPLHAPLLSRALFRFLRERDGKYLIHGLGPWTYVGALVRRRLAQLGKSCALLSNTYDTHDREGRARFAGSMLQHGRLQHLQNYLEKVWTSTVVADRERRGYQDSDRVVVNYDSVRLALLEGYVTDEKISIQPYTTESAVLNRSLSLRGAPNDPPVIVAASRHDTRKGMDILVRALAQIHAKKIPFRAILVGPGPLLEKHRKLARRLGLGSETQILGAVEDSFTYLQLGDIFVLPSLEEGSSSMSMLEAMQVGLSVVATNIDGVPEDIVDGVNGLLVSSGDPHPMAEALTRLLRDPELRAQLSQRSRADFHERFSVEAFRKSLLSTYASLGFVP